MSLALPVDPISVVCMIDLSLGIPVPVGLFAHSVALASLPLAVVLLSSESIVTPRSLLHNPHRVYCLVEFLVIV